MGVRNTIRRIVNSDYGIISQLYNTIMILAIIASIIPLLTRDTKELFIELDIIACCFFIIDYILRWITYDTSEKENPKLAFILYPLTPMAIVDFLSIIPTIGSLNPSLKLFRLTRLFKILRVFKFFRYYKPMRVLTNVLKKESRTLFTVFGFAVFYIFITALIMYNTEESKDPETGEYILDSFYDALYWAACTLTTVGYGDICPVSNIGRLISMISALTGVAIIALPSGIITASYMDELRRWDLKEKHEREMRAEKRKTRKDKKEREKKE